MYPRVRTAVITPVIMVLLTFCALASTTAQEHTTARSLGAGMRLKFTDLSQGTFRACKLSDGHKEVMFIAGVNNILINGHSVELDEATRWNGSSFLLSRKDAERIAARLQKRLRVNFRKPIKALPKRPAARKQRIIS